VFVFLFFLMLNSGAKLRNISALTQSFIQQALERAQRMIAEGVFGKRAQRAWFANLKTNAQSESEPKSMTSSVQMSGAQ
jgi:hypothetical protein